MELLDRVTVDPEICHGSPTIRGLRYPVSMIMGLLATGVTTDDVLADYADLERDDVLAALEQSAKVTRTRTSVPTSAVQMRLLVDAQLPVRLVSLLIELGHDVVHTSELPNGNRTADREITGIAEVQDRIVVPKDRDFVDGHLLSAEPRRLLLVSTGNIRNDDLVNLFARYSEALVCVRRRRLRRTGPRRPHPPRVTTVS